MGASARTSAFRYGLLALAVGLLGSAAAATAPPAQASVTVLGAGSTWDQIATNQWAADVHTLYGITINYQGVGSTAGRQFYIENQVDFGDSDIPFQNTPNENELAELASEHKTYQYLPTVAGATGIMYNLRTPSGKKIENLRLDSHALTGIFTGTIKSWSDPAITKQNPQLRGLLPHTAIIPVVRADGSGTSAMFSDYLRQLQPAMWHHFCSTYHISPCGQISFWPLDIAGSVAQKGSDGVANYVQQQTNSITYVETGYALARNFPVVYVRNQSGHYVFPSSQADAAALTHARIRSDLISDLSGVHTAPEAGAYPIAGYSYMITPTKLQYGFTAAKGAVLGKYIVYSACAGQKKAASLGYAPLTPVLVKGVFAAVRRIPGAAAPPPLSQCANPTLTGASTSSQTSNSGDKTPPPGSQQSNGPGKNSSKGPKTGAKSGPTSPLNGVQSLASQPGVTLTAAQLVARRLTAAKALSGVQEASTSPLAWAIVDILVIALCPWVIWHRRRQAAQADMKPSPGGG